MVALIPFLTALILSLVLAPMLRRLSHHIGAVSKPREDRWHPSPIPMLGGAGIYLAFWAGLLASYRMNGQIEQVRWGLLIGSGAIFLLGLYDDFRPMTPQSKLIGQILVSTIVVASGYTTHFFSASIDNAIVARLLDIVLTYFWLVGITNAINLLDNMDGLAGGISFITAGILSFFFSRSADLSLLSISIALAGGILGFLVYNFPPASIFMGDSGSMFLGFTLAVLAIARQPQASNVFAVLGVPSLLFLLPILDTALVAFTRLLRGQPLTQGGRDHTSHRLIAFGLSERQAVLALYIISLVAGVLAATLESIQYWFSLVLVPLLVVSLALLFGYLGGLKVIGPRNSKPVETRLARIMLELTFRRRLLEVGLDFLLIGLAYYLASLLGQGLLMDETRLGVYLNTLPIFLAGGYLSFFIFGVYRGVWRYVGLSDLIRFFVAAAGGTALSYVLTFGLISLGTSFWNPGESPSPLIFLLYGVFLFLGLTATRSSFRILGLLAPHPVDPHEISVLIYGAGDTGMLTLDWLRSNPGLSYHPVGFLDDDPYLRGRWIHGLEVLGGSDQLEALLAEHKIAGVILTRVESIPDLHSLVERCRQHGCWVLRMAIGLEPLTESS